MAMSATLPALLDQPYVLDAQQIARFRRDGFIKLKDVLSPEALAAFQAVVTPRVLAENPNRDKPMEERSTYDKAFIQVMNLWERYEDIRQMVFSRRLARIATDLLQVNGVRMFHDQALYKEPSGGFTPWHADQYYWPLASDRTITAWIPFHAVPADMGPLAFAAGSQQMTYGRDLEISDQSEQLLADALKREGYAVHETPYDLGEVSYHLGWCYHRAGGNTTDKGCVHCVLLASIRQARQFFSRRHGDTETQRRDGKRGTRKIITLAFLRVSVPL